MKNYRLNSLMGGLLYLLGTAFGILSSVTGGKLMSSLVQTRPLPGAEILGLAAAESFRLTGGALFVLLMGISLVAMTVYLYPVFRKDSEELALGLVLFRGALEGAWYFVTALSILLLGSIGLVYAKSSGNTASLDLTAQAVYQFQNQTGPVGTIFFVIGATCLYISFFRTRLIPRWLSVWGLIGVVPYTAYAVLHIFGQDKGFGMYLQMVLAPQEMVMAFWLILKGFDNTALQKLVS